MANLDEMVRNALAKLDSMTESDFLGICLKYGHDPLAPEVDDYPVHNKQLLLTLEASVSVSPRAVKNKFLDLSFYQWRNQRSDCSNTENVAIAA